MPDRDETQLLIIALSGEGALALCDLDVATGALILREKVALPGVEGACGGMPIVANAAGDRVYAAWRGADKRLFAFALDHTDGRLDPLSDAPLPASMCYVALTADDRRIVTASMGDSTVAVSPVGADGKPGAPLSIQDAPFAHCLVEAPSGLFYAPSLRGGFVQAYALSDDESALRPVSRYTVPKDSGPRHIRFTKDGGTAYLLSEFIGGITRLDVASDGGLTARETILLLPNGEKAWAAELHLSQDERTLYASERNTSQLFTIALSNAGMTIKQTTPAPDCPRAFGPDATGRVLVALGETSGEARTYHIGRDGALTPAGSLDVGDGPSWVLCFGPSHPVEGAK